MKKLFVEYEIPYYINNKQEGVITKKAELYFKGEVTGSFQDWVREAQYQEFCASAYQCESKNDWTYFNGVRQPINKIVTESPAVYEHIPLEALRKAKEISTTVMEVFPNALGKIYNGVFYGETPHRNVWLVKSGLTLPDFFLNIIT